MAQPNYPQLANYLQGAAAEIALIPNAPGQLATSVQQLTTTVQALATTVQEQSTSIQALKTTVQEQSNSIQALTTTVNNMQTTVNNVQTTVNNMQTQLNRIDSRSARTANRLLAGPDTLHVVLDANGGIPGLFPITANEVWQLEGQPLTDALNAYSQPTNSSQAAKRRRLAQQLGIQVPANA